MSTPPSLLTRLGPPYKRPAPLTSDVEATSKVRRTSHPVCLSAPAGGTLIPIPTTKACTAKAPSPLSTVNWCWDTQSCATIAELPLCTDNATSAERKLLLLRGIVERGESLARATGWLAADDDEDLAYRWVRNNLTPSEFSRYIAWKECSSLPAIPWLKFPSDTYEEPESKIWNPLVDALNTIYPGHNISPEQAQWFASTYSDDMPLVRAVVKTRQAGLIFITELALWTSPEKGEAQTAKRIVAAATSSLTPTPDVPEAIARSIRQSIRVLNTREGALECKVVELEYRMRGGMAKKESASP